MICTLTKRNLITLLTISGYRPIKTASLWVPRLFSDNNIFDNNISDEHISDCHISDNRTKCTFFPTIMKCEFFPTHPY